MKRNYFKSSDLKNILSSDLLFAVGLEFPKDAYEGVDQTQIAFERQLGEVNEVLEEHLFGKEQPVGVIASPSSTPTEYSAATIHAMESGSPVKRPCFCSNLDEIDDTPPASIVSYPAFAKKEGDNLSVYFFAPKVEPDFNVRSIGADWNELLLGCAFGSYAIKKSGFNISPKLVVFEKDYRKSENDAYKGLFKVFDLHNNDTVGIAFQEHLSQMGNYVQEMQKISARAHSIIDAPTEAEIAGRTFDPQGSQSGTPKGLLQNVYENIFQKDLPDVLTLPNRTPSSIFKTIAAARTLGAPKDSIPSLHEIQDAFNEAEKNVDYEENRRNGRKVHDELREARDIFKALEVAKKPEFCARINTIDTTDVYLRSEEINSFVEKIPASNLCYIDFESFTKVLPTVGERSNTPYPFQFSVAIDNGPVDVYTADPVGFSKDAQKETTKLGLDLYEKTKNTGSFVAYNASAEKGFLHTICSCMMEYAAREDTPSEEVEKISKATILFLEKAGGPADQKSQIFKQFEGKVPEGFAEKISPETRNEIERLITPDKENPIEGTMVDPLPIFAKRAIYCKEMGDASLKTIANYFGGSYSDNVVKNGAEALRIYADHVQEKRPLDEKTKNNLEEYVKIDVVHTRQVLEGIIRISQNTPMPRVGQDYVMEPKENVFPSEVKSMPEAGSGNKAKADWKYFKSAGGAEVF